MCRGKGSDFDECALTDGVTPLSLPPHPLQLLCHGRISRSNHLLYLPGTARTQHREHVNSMPTGKAAVLPFFTHILKNTEMMDGKNVESGNYAEDLVLTF